MEKSSPETPKWGDVKICRDCEGSAAVGGIVKLSLFEHLVDRSPRVNGVGLC